MSKCVIFLAAYKDITGDKNNFFHIAEATEKATFMFGTFAPKWPKLRPRDNTDIVMMRGRRAAVRIVQFVGTCGLIAEAEDQIFKRMHS